MNMYEHGSHLFVANYIKMEFIVVIIQCIIYRKLLSNKDEQNTKTKYPCIYAIVANIVSFILGVFIANIVPGIF